MQACVRRAARGITMRVFAQSAGPDMAADIQCCRRMTEAVLEFVRLHPGQKILVGSHGAAIGSYLSSIMDGIDHNYTRMLPQPAVFRLRFQEENILSADRLLLQTQRSMGNRFRFPWTAVCAITQCFGSGQQPEAGLAGVPRVSTGSASGWGWSPRTAAW